MLPIEFNAFSGDCRIHGRLTLFGDRLTDMLNDQKQFRVSKVTLESLEDGHTLEVDSIVLERTDLLIAIATGPRGLGSRRIETDWVRMQLGIGPYVVAGELHAEHGADPLRSAAMRRPMVPLTAATVAFTSGGEIQVVDAETVIVNRELVEWIVPTADEADHFPEVPVRSRLDGVLKAKDYTGAAAI
jgi:hypothetical protein